jgi:hypoxanthine phosphoribosyltransferase
MSGLLIYFERGGAAEFDLLGQKFSSSNIGLAVLFFAVLIFVFVLREFVKETGEQEPQSPTYATLNQDQSLSWDQVIDGINELVLELTASGGFRPDLIVGICGGGLVVADIVSKRLGHIPCVSIWSNRHHSSDETAFTGQALAVNLIDFDEIVSQNSVRRILVVDDVVYSGGTLSEAVDFLLSCSDQVRDTKVEVRTAALFALTSAKFKPDYSIFSHSRDRKMMPASDRLRT